GREAAILYNAVPFGDGADRFDDAQFVEVFLTDPRFADFQLDLDLISTVVDGFEDPFGCVLTTADLPIAAWCRNRAAVDDVEGCVFGFLVGFDSVFDGRLHRFVVHDEAERFVDDLSAEPAP